MLYNLIVWHFRNIAVWQLGNIVVWQYGNMAHKRFKCWWLALPEKKTITKPLINSTFNHGLPEGPSYPVLTIIKELLRQFES